MEIIERERYLNIIRQWMGKDLIIVLTGQRRVGKSCLLKQWCEKMSNEGNVIYIDKEKHEFDGLSSYKELNEYIDNKLQKGQKNFILIDEVQDIAGFERSLRSYYSTPNTEVIVTGSNAKMLSSELTTLIGGRYKEIYVQPLDYSEFLKFHQLADNDESLASYIEYGGMPGLVNIGLDANNTPQYLKDIYSTTLLKDVVMRNQIRNVNFLDKLVKFIADNIGKLISATNISKYMKTIGESISPSVIINYLDMLAEAYLLHKVNRYDLHGKRIFESNEKYYFEDNGIRNSVIGGSRSSDIEKVLENIVYQQLVRMGYGVYVGQLQAGEIDFVCSKPNGERAYVQVAYLIVNEETRQREFGNLKAIRDNYPKYVISMSPLVRYSNEDGIAHLHLRHFLKYGFERD